jgi:hypothetical protein
VNVEEMLDIVARVDDWLDSSASPDYLAQPLANDWRRVTKCAEEAGEVWASFSRSTMEDTRATWDVVCAALAKAGRRAAEKQGAAS